MKVTKAETGEVLDGIPTARLAQLGSGRAYFVPTVIHGQPSKLGVWYAVLPAEGYPAPEGARVERVIIRND